MNPIVTTVQNATWGLIPATEQTPKPIWAIFKGVHYIHQLWRWYRHAEVYSNPDNFQNLMLGHVLNYVAGDNTVLRIAAQCVLIANRILTCVEQCANMFNAYQQLANAIKGNYPRHRISKWSTKQPSSIYSPSTKQWMKKGWDSAGNRVKRIAIALFCLFKEMFKLSMCIMDAIESFSLSPTTRNESINQLFVNATQSIDRLVGTQEMLRDGLVRHREIIAQFLIGMGSQWKVEYLIGTVESTLEGAKKIQKVAHFGDGIIPDLGKRMIYGAAQGLGMESYLSWQPDPEPKWLKAFAEAKPTRKARFVLSEGARAKREKWRGHHPKALSANLEYALVGKT